MTQNAILAGLIGAGIQASRTPALHEHEGDAQGLRYLYRLIDLDQLKLDSGALPDLIKADNLMMRKDGTLVFSDPVFME